jgi:succinate-semialdehyde dehydrogenase / glutarate-semialdehyde dehydrogenase
LALINPVSSLDDAIQRANPLPYGLAAYAFTRSARTADRLADELEAGNRSIHHFVASIAETPFGGVKEIGYGREGAAEGLACYTVTKNVSHLML